MTRPLPDSPLLVAYGMGVDSTALLVGLAVRGIRPDLILFADTGGEKPGTIAYLPVIQAWLAARGFPAVEVVRYRTRPTTGYTTLEGECLKNQVLPGIVFGRGSCSSKWKQDAQAQRLRTWTPAQDAWRARRPLVRAIGYDAGPSDTKRACAAGESGVGGVGRALVSPQRHEGGVKAPRAGATLWKKDDRYRNWYPLREWGWDRARCEAEILAAGLPVPPKSACYFCPASKVEEIAALGREHPELLARRSPWKTTPGTASTRSARRGP